MNEIVYNVPQKRGGSKMYWSRIVEALHKEETVNVPYEANITGKIVGFKENGPIYNYHVQYFTESTFVEKDFDTLEELYDCVMSNKAFRKCRVCGNVITNDFYVCREPETEEANVTKEGKVIESNEYCCISCLLHDMNKLYGKTGFDFEPLSLDEYPIENTEYLFKKAAGQDNNGNIIYKPMKIELVKVFEDFCFE